MQPLGLVKLQGAGHGVEDFGGDAADMPFLQAHVPLGAHTGQDGDLFAPQAGHAPPPAARLQPGLLRGDLGAPGGQELADLGSVVHGINVTSARRRQGGCVRTPITATSRGRAVTGYMEDAGNVAGQQGRLPRGPGQLISNFCGRPRARSYGMPKQSAPKSLSGVAPKLVELTGNVLFGDVWERPGLSPRDRSLITVTTLAALYRTEQLGYHLTLARENGLSEQELAEAITHLAFCAGWPSAMTAITQLNGLVEETGGPGA